MIIKFGSRAAVHCEVNGNVLITVDGAPCSNGLIGQNFGSGCGNLRVCFGHALQVNAHYNTKYHRIMY